jgi:hypothetical protein
MLGAGIDELGRAGGIDIEELIIGQRHHEKAKDFPEIRT